MAVSTIMESEKAVTLQLKNRLVMTVIPFPVTEIVIEGITQLLNLTYPVEISESRREYLAVVVQHSTLRIYNYISLKQIIEIDLKARIGK